jgi:hypoxanthine phosphoribosyltransferase
MQNLTPTYDEIHKACFNMAMRSVAHGYRFDRIIGVSRGGLLPAVMLSHMLDIPMTAINYSSSAGKGDNKNHVNILPNVTESRLLIVDDICDSGHTLKEIAAYYSGKLKACYTGCLFYKELTSPIHIPDLYWQKIPEDAGWVEFPFEKNHVVY